MYCSLKTSFVFPILPVCLMLLFFFFFLFVNHHQARSFISSQVFTASYHELFLPKQCRNSHLKFQSCVCPLSLHHEKGVQTLIVVNSSFKNSQNKLLALPSYMQCYIIQTDPLFLTSGCSWKIVVVACCINILQSNTDLAEPGKMAVIVFSFSTVTSSKLRCCAKYRQRTLSTLCGHPQYEAYCQSNTSCTFMKGFAKSTTCELK